MDETASEPAPTRSDDDAALVGRAADGDAEAFRSLVVRHQASLLAVVRDLLPGFADREDVAQDAFVAAWLHLAEFDPARGAFFPWLVRIARRGGRVLLNGRSLPLDGPAIGTDDSVRVEHNGERTYQVRVHLEPTAESDAPECSVPDGSFFLLGDSRDVSMDSRTFGPVPRGDLIGRADYVFLPVGGWDRAGALSDGR